ncbi:MAG: hypothetical protein KAR40_13780 [Candidatus Sabulitectum sp.]|nr:hypothetical protein [Candidatus Sabulitectum sp.]
MERNVITDPYRNEANQMCSILVKEIVKTGCWADMQDCINAINVIRAREIPMSAEWEHLHKPDMGTPAQTR